MKLSSRFKYLNLILLFLLFTNAGLSAKSSFAFPAEVLQYMRNLPEEKQVYSINKVKKNNAGDQIYGPFETKEQVILVWIASNTKPNDKTCIARKGNLYTKNPVSYEREIYGKVKDYYDSFGLDEAFAKYFDSEALNSANSVIKVSADDLSLNKEQKNTGDNLETEVTLDGTSIPSTGNSAVSETDSASSPAALTAVSSVNTSVTETASSASSDESSSASTASTAGDSATSSDSLSVSEQPNNSTSAAEIPVKEESPTVFELPVSKSSTISSKYQKEYLQDYAPKKNLELPVDISENIEETKIENPDLRDKDQRTLLMLAAQKGNNWEINSLISSGADINAVDKDGWTALMYAVRYQQNTQIVNSLIKAGAQIKIKNNFDLSPLILAATYNGNPEIIKILLNNYTSSEKEVLQAFILLLSDNSCSEYSKEAKIDVFLEKSVPLNSFYKGKTPLMYAAQYSSSTKILQKLMDAGASTAILSTDGKTAFDYASENKTINHDNTYWELNKK